MDTEDTEDLHRVRILREVDPICVNVTPDGVTTVLLDRETMELLVLPGSIEWIKNED